MRKLIINLRVKNRKMTEKTQQKIINKALGKINNQLFIAVITETKHPKDAIKVEHEGKEYFVTLQFGDFACIYLN